MELRKKKRNAWRKEGTSTSFWFIIICLLFG